MVSNLTYKILALSEFPEINADESIDWAIDMISLGYNVPSLYMLASFSKPTSYFEIIKYVEIVAADLGFQVKTGMNAIASYACYLILQMQEGEYIRMHLGQLCNLCMETNLDEIVYNFYLLHWAWDQLDYEDNGYNHYWESARRSNIEQIVLNEARQWLANHKPTLKI